MRLPYEIRPAGGRAGSVIALAGAHAPAENPIHHGGIAQDDRKQDERADEQEGLRGGPRGGVPDRERGRNEVREGGNRQPEIAEQEQHDRGNEWPRARSLVEPSPGRQRRERRDDR